MSKFAGHSSEDPITRNRVAEKRHRRKLVFGNPVYRKFTFLHKNVRKQGGRPLPQPTSAHPQQRFALPPKRWALLLLRLVVVCIVGRILMHDDTQTGRAAFREIHALQTVWGKLGGPGLLFLVAPGIE